MNDEGWCGGYDVFLPGGRPTQVLGPDGDPVYYLHRHKAGFDLSPKPSDYTSKASSKTENASV